MRPQGMERISREVRCRPLSEGVLPQREARVFNRGKGLHGLFRGLCLCGLHRNISKREDR